MYPVRSCAGYKTFQISVQQVMDATGIDLSVLIPYDGFSQHERVHGVPIAITDEECRASVLPLL